MKKSFTHIFAFILSTFGILSSANAADLVVAAGGAGGAYSSINAALTVAAAGDRIIVYPQPGGASFSESTITITKSIQILSANEGAYYAVDAPAINIAPASPGISVTIIGMKLFTGSISTTIASPAGTRSKINLLNDSLAIGSISFNHDNYDATVASCNIYTNLNFRFGKAIGNILRDGQIAVTTDASVNNPNDTVMIIGNKITHNNGLVSGAGIQWNSTSHFFSIQNNYLNMTTPFIGYNYALYITTSKISLAGSNNLTNNTITKASAAFAYGMLVTTQAPSYTEVNNNLIASAGGTFYFSGGTFGAHYNMSVGALSLGLISNDGTNVLATNTVLNADGLNTNALSNTINGGNPDSAYADINLTRNDVGCYGGSFTLNNFFPITANDWARVILVTAPRRVLVNGTINVKAIGFDK